MIEDVPLTLGSGGCQHAASHQSGAIVLEKGSSNGITHRSFVQQVEGTSDPRFPKFPRRVRSPRAENLKEISLLQL